MGKVEGFYILIASEQFDADRNVVVASTIFEKLMGLGKWFLSDETPYRKAYNKGDRVVFYLAGPKHRYFVGSATVADAAKAISTDDANTLKRLGLYCFREELPLTDIIVWNIKKPIKPLVESLAFIKDKKNYGLNLRQAAVRINQSDYNVIVE